MNHSLPITPIEAAPAEREASQSATPAESATVWRYGLKHMLVLMTILCFLFAWIGASSLRVGTAISLGALFVAAHFLGAIVGTRLGASAPTRAEAQRTGASCGPVDDVHCE